MITTFGFALNWSVVARTSAQDMAPLAPPIAKSSYLRGRGPGIQDADGMSSLPAGEAGAIAIGGDLSVNRMGFGAMRVRGASGIEVLRRAVALGVNFVDTADVYGPETSELLIAEALHPYPEGLVIATKGGIRYAPNEDSDYDGRPEYLRAACERSLRRLRLERIDLYQLHRVDPAVPIEESVGALAALAAEGKIRHVGLSNVSADQLARAQAVAPVVSVQNRYSVGNLGYDPLVDVCEREGVAFLPWYPLDAGSLVDTAGPLARLAAERGATTAQVALAWLLHRSPAIVAIPGTSSVAHLEENVAAAAVRLTDEDVALAAA